MKAQSKAKRAADVTRKELLSLPKEYKLRGFKKWNKPLLLSVLSKAKKILFKKDDLQKLQIKQLRNVAK